MEESDDIIYLYKKYRFISRNIFINAYRKFLVAETGLVFLKEFSGAVIPRISGIVNTENKINIENLIPATLYQIIEERLPLTDSNALKLEIAEDVLSKGEVEEDKIIRTYESMIYYTKQLEKFFEEFFRLIGRIYVPDYKLEVKGIVYQVIKEIEVS